MRKALGTSSQVGGGNATNGKHKTQSSNNITAASSPSSLPFIDPQQQRRRRQQCRNSDKVLVLLAATACILSITHIYMHSRTLPSHHHGKGNQHPHHKNFMKDALDNFVQKGNTNNTNKDRKFDAKQQLAVADEAEKENDNSTKQNIVKAIKANDEPSAEPNSNASSDGDEGSNKSVDAATKNDKTASAAVGNVKTKSEVVKTKTNGLDKKEDKEVKNDENKKPTLKEKVMSFFGKNGNGIKHDLHPVAHLNCADHGGPTDPHIIDEMVFWVRHSAC